MAGFETIIYEKKNGVAWITINRPHALNAFNIKMRDELFEILTAIEMDIDVKVAIIKGNGEKAFCAGADLSEFLTAPPPTEARGVRFMRDLWGLFVNMPKPFIAAIHGYTFGSGVEIAACCDIRVASDDAIFCLPEVSLGIMPAAGGTQTIPRLIGRGRSLELLLTGRRISAKEAYEMGLINRVIPREELYPVANEFAEIIAGYDSDAVQRVKIAIVKGLDMPLAHGLLLEKLLADMQKSKLIIN
jgi:enoyl-CoA hydratase/carnithine racemase